MSTALAKYAEQLIKVGGDEPGVMMGPMQNEMQYEKVKELFAEAKQKTARCSHSGHSAGSPDTDSPAISGAWSLNPNVVKTFHISGFSPPYCILHMPNDFMPLLPSSVASKLPFNASSKSQANL